MAAPEWDQGINKGGLDCQGYKSHINRTCCDAVHFRRVAGAALEWVQGINKGGLDC